MQRVLVTLLVAGLAGVTALSQEPAPPALPPPASHAIDFARDVAPIFSKSCVRCHARGQSKGRFSLETREGLLKGGRAGAAVAPGRSADSLLVQLVAGLDPEMIMPEKGSRLSAAEIGVLRAWIDQGAPWDDRVSFARQPPRNLDPRLPPLPPATGALTHPVDRLLAAHAGSAAADAPRADDRVLARRLHLDLVGMLPRPEDVDAFVADSRPDKVERLAATLLADRQRYATHWLTFWNDLLRNDYRGPGYIDGGRRQISGWLYSALADNMPFDRFVYELVNPGPRSEGFTRGIIWRGVVNASQTPPMQAAQNISQVFMGVNLKCASCHDSFINEWQLADAYGLAGVYADSALEMVECDRPTGKTAPLKFLYPSLGTIDADADRAERVRQLAQVLVDRKNGRLSRTIVNRLWARLFGRGLVEPLDDMDQPSWHPDLLDWLAEDLVAHQFDLQHTLARLVTSQAYQRVAVDEDVSTQDSPVFRGPAARRLTAEQFADGLGAITGVWPAEPAPEFETLLAVPDEAPRPRAAWIWNGPRAVAVEQPARVFFRGAFDVAQVPVHAPLVVAHPRQFVLHVNGVQVAAGGGPSRPRVVDIAAHLRPGRNVLALAVTGPAADPARPVSSSPTTPQALFVQVQARRDEDAPLEVVFGSGADWRWSAQERKGWEQPLFPDRAWARVVEVPVAVAQPAAAQKALQAALSATTLYGLTRAALGPSTPLTTALGRPGREQVVTVRADAPTTLQALELANGETFSALLRHGAARLRGESGATASVITTRVFRRAFGRSPSPEETRLALEVLGAGPNEAPGVAQVEDLLWAVVMLPEFRLVQ
jgi:mono/diheme cytochrome c family protein